jgi:hypothetical protein
MPADRSVVVPGAVLRCHDIHARPRTFRVAHVREGHLGRVAELEPVKVKSVGEFVRDDQHSVQSCALAVTSWQQFEVVSFPSNPVECGVLEAVSAVVATLEGGRKSQAELMRVTGLQPQLVWQALEVLTGEDRVRVDGRGVISLRVGGGV